MKKVFVLGAAGMAGHMISMYLKTTNNYDIIDICHISNPYANSVNLDVCDLPGVERAVNEEKPDIIINCIGILNKGINEKITDAIYVNAYFPRWLEKYCLNKKTKIIHLSTDCVFSGITGGYTELSIPDGTDIYARTKVLGEIINEKDLTIRTSIIGPELKKDGTGLFHWFMNQSGRIQGYTQVHWTGVTTLQLAICINEMIKADLSGLYHLVPPVYISKYKLLCIIKEVFNRKTNIIMNTDFKCNRTLVNTRNDFSMPIPGYKEMICQLKEWMNNNHKLYDNIYDNFI